MPDQLGRAATQVCTALSVTCPPLAWWVIALGDRCLAAQPALPPDRAGRGVHGAKISQPLDQSNDASRVIGQLRQVTRRPPLILLASRLDRLRQRNDLLNFYHREAA